MSDATKDLTRDHAALSDTQVTRRYFAKFGRITGHLARVAGQMEAEGRLNRREVEVLARYLVGLGFTFKALANKHHWTGRKGAGFSTLIIDRHESGFPVHGELMQMTSDAAQAARHLKTLPGVDDLKRQMVAQIVGELSIPTKLQYALSQRLYYEEMLKGHLFWPQMDPDVIWLGNNGHKGQGARRRYLIHWAVYDSELNIPTIYLMECEDTGRTALPKDERRWPEAQAHLMAQAVAGLKLVTIATGFDRDFDDLHPKTLRRIHVGPMYSHAFTRQTGPLREVLEEAKSPPGEDWALAWTVEELESERVELEKSGWFGSVEREVYALDPFSGRGADTGTTRMERSIIMPQRPYQVLAEKNPPGFRDVRKFVVSPGGRVLSYR
jgi:hypothetical protein